MIISHKYKFIFIHIHKCSGTSITHALAPYLGEDDIVLGCTEEGEKLSEQGRKSGGLHKHSSASEAIEIIDSDIWNSYFKFTFVRNPWDILVSTYHWWLTTSWEGEDKPRDKIRSLNDFEEYVLSPHCRKRTCLDYIKSNSGNIAVDFIGSLEQLHQDFSTICYKLGLPEIPLKQLNKSRHNKYKDYYNPLTRDLVSQWFKEDIDKFNYTFTDQKKSFQSIKDNINSSRKPDKLIIHNSHHRAGTVWFGRILRKIANEYGWKFHSGDQKDLDSDIDIFLQPNSRIDFSTLPPYIGSHIIRDPRDMVVSGYFYHLWCNEKWCKLKENKLGGQSYQEILNNQSIERGITMEISRSLSKSLTNIIIMEQWNYLNPNILELRFEDMIKNSEEKFSELFKWYGFSGDMFRTALALSQKLDFTKMSSREKGEEDTNHHFRKGVAGDWKNYFNEEHKRLFKELAPNLLVQLGYEKNDDW